MAVDEDITADLSLLTRGRERLSRDREELAREPGHIVRDLGDILPVSETFVRTMNDLPEVVHLILAS